MWVRKILALRFQCFLRQHEGKAASGVFFSLFCFGLWFFPPDSCKENQFHSARRWLEVFQCKDWAVLFWLIIMNWLWKAPFWWHFQFNYIFLSIRKRTQAWAHPQSFWVYTSWFPQSNLTTAFLQIIVNSLFVPFFKYLILFLVKLYNIHLEFRSI